MKNLILFISLLFSSISFSQDLKLKSDYSSDNSEIRDILRIEGIEMMKLQFTGKELKGKTYHLTVKEIWDGKIVSESTVLNSAEIEFEQFQKISDTVFKIKVISKLTPDDELKMTFSLGQIAITKKYKALKTDDYSLRCLPEESKMKIDYNKKFYLMAYILPTEREDGSRSWCDVGTSGADAENWGKKFGIKHYLLFEMIFE